MTRTVVQTLLLVSLLWSSASAQTVTHLRNLYKKTSTQITEMYNEVTNLDSTYFTDHQGLPFRNITAAILQRGYSASDFASLSAAKAAARDSSSYLIIPRDFSPNAVLSMTSADSNLVVHDFRYGYLSKTGRESWGFKSAWEVDSLTRFIKAYDSVRTQGRLSLAEGTWALDSLHIDRAISIQGTNATRIRPVDVSYGGSMLKSSNNTGRDLLTISAPGVNLSDLTLHGNSRLNGHGVLASRRPNASGVITTTLGGYSLRRVNSAFHGGNGIHLRGADGIILHDIETYGNGGFGIAIVSPSFDSASSAGNTAGGTTNIVLGGRSRANGQGGILSADQAATLLLGAEAIADTGYAVWFNDGRSRGGSLWGDFELNVPPRVPNPILTAVRIDNHNAFMMMNSYVGTKHTFGTFTADAGTNTTTIVDAALVNYGPNDWLTGSDITNTSRSSARRRITDYDAATGTLTLASAITGQTTGDTYIIRKYLNRAIHLDSLSSGIFINNNIDHESDTSMAVTGYAYITAFNNVNFDPADDVKAIGGATVKWFNYNLSKVDSLSGGDARFTSNTEVQFITSDSLILRTTGVTTGISLEALDKVRLVAQDVVQLQPNADGHVYLFDNAQDEEREDLRIYGDADLNVGSLNRQYIRFAFSSATANALTVANSADSIYFGLASPMLISGDNQTERRIEFVNHTGGTAIPTPTSGRVSLYSRGDTLYAKDDGGTERSLYAAAGASGDITDVNAGNGLIGGGTTGSVTLNLNPKLSNQTIAITSDSVHVRDESIGATQLSSTTVTPGSYTAADITVDADGRITAAASGAGGSGDITSVGDVASGAAFDGTQGTTLTFNNAGGDATQAYDGSVIAFSHPITVQASDPADAEAIRLDNAEGIAWEASPAGTDVTLKVDASEILQASGAFNASAITEATNAVPNATDHLGFFAATTSAQLATVLSDETGSGVSVFGTSPTITTSISQDGDAADAGYLRLQNAANIAWEASPAGTDVTLGVDASEIIQASATINATALTEANNAVPNATDHLGFFAATTSAQLAGVVSDETGTGAVVLAVSPALTGTPTFANGATSAGIARILEDTDDGSNYTEFTVPALAANISYTLPPDDGDAGEQLQTNGNGVLTWEVAGSGSGISTATARANTGWTSNGTTATDTLARSYILDKANLQVHFVDADNDSVSFVPQSLYPINYKDATTQLWAVDSTGAMALADGVKQTFNPNGTTAGLNFGSQAGNPSSLANGDVWYNSTTGKLMGREGGVSYPIVNDYDPSTTFAIYDDFITGSANTSGAMGSANWQRTIATSGTTTHQDGEAGRPGIMQLFCANSAGSTAALHSHTTSFKLSGLDYYKGSVKLSTLGTAGSNGALYRFGWADGVATSYPSNGAWIEFNVDSSATRWRAITASGGTRTITTYTGSTVSATTWYKLEILTNSNASSVDFSVDGTVIATHTTNIPTSNGIGALMMAGAVTASATKNAVVDYVLYMQSNLSR